MDSDRDTLTTSGFAFGTFGELLQGSLPPSGDLFLITMPIQRGSLVSFRLVSGSQALSIDPPHKQKSLEMARKLLARIGRPPVGHLVVESDLPEGKGMASSSADMIATARAIHAFYPELSISDEELALLACAIEPSDGVMFDGCVAFKHRSGELIRRFPEIPQMAIVCVDEGGTIDTVDFNARRPESPLFVRPVYGELIDMAHAAVTQGDLRQIGQVATMSALLNQEILPKRTLEATLRIAKRHGALGVAVTHSGPCLGVLLDAASADLPAATRTVEQELSELGCPVWVELTRGPATSAYRGHAPARHC